MPSSSTAALRAQLEDALTHLKLARAQNAHLHRELATAVKRAGMAPAGADEGETARLALTHLREAHALLRLHYEEATRRIAELQHALAVAHTVLHWDPLLRSHASLAPEDRHVDALLLRLLTLAHPDKWSQGQPATELAHELTVAITAVRQARAAP
jgi:hypothetical protein